jgi:hypothetical protein
MALTIIYLVALAATIWVIADTASLGVKRGCLGGGFADMGRLGWALCMLLIWIIALPLYLATRPKYVERKRTLTANPGQALNSGAPIPPLPAGPPPAWYADPHNPGNLRWWDGTAWGPTAPAQAPPPPPKHS